jgi:hypothetical protein
MHMVLLSIDLLRMHNNKAVFADFKKNQAGFYEILKDLPAAGNSGSAATAAAAAAAAFPAAADLAAAEMADTPPRPSAASGVPEAPAPLAEAEQEDWRGIVPDTAADWDWNRGGSSTQPEIHPADDEDIPPSSSSSSSFSSSSAGSSSGHLDCAAAAAGAAVPLTLKAAANGSVTVARKAAEELEYPELHNLSAEDLHSIAAIVATVLLVQKVQRFQQQQQQQQQQRVQGEGKCADTCKTVSSSPVACVCYVLLNANDRNTLSAGVADVCTIYAYFTVCSLFRAVHALCHRNIRQTGYYPVQAATL